MRYAPLTREQREQLKQVETSSGIFVRYYPCDVRLRSGESVTCVYICEEDSWHQEWAVWPEEDRGKRSIQITDVEEIRSSIHRLPARFITDIGEIGMGGCGLGVVFDDGSRINVISGNAVDFIDYPAGKSAANVVDVVDYAKKGRIPTNAQHGRDYWWCLFSGEV